MKKKLWCLFLSVFMMLTLTVSQVFAYSGEPYDASKVYYGGDVVTYNGVEYTAKWYTKGETPGVGFSAWERTREIDADGNTVWYEGMVSVAGDRVSYNGSLYEANWWTQSAPGSDSSWTLVSGDPVNPPVDPTDPVDPVDPPVDPTDPVDPVDPPVTPQDPYGPTSTVYSDYTVSESLVAEGADEHVVVGYLPTYRASFESSIDWACLTHIIYSFGSPDGVDGLQPLENPQLARTLVAHGHANGVKVLFGVGGWADNFSGILENVFYQGTATTAQIESLTDDIVGIVETYGFDGVDIDWEHPRIHSDSYQRYEAFMIMLREKLGPDMILTSAVLPGVDTLGGIYADGEAHTPNVMAVCNWFNVMAYEANSTMEYSQACISYWCGNRQMPGNKVVLGAPFYSQGSYALTYAELLAQYPEAAVSDMAGTAYYHNCPQTLYDKTTWALNYGLGGMMVWEIGQDIADPEDSLIRAIYNAKCDFEGVDPVPFIEVGDEPIPGADDPYEWSSAAYYVAGNQVIYNGAVYRANWWTTSIPGSDASWTLVSGTPEDPVTPPVDPPTDPETPVDPPTDPETPEDPPASDIPTWYEGLVRMRGDQTYYNGQLYQANWWTISVPGSDASWTLIGPA